MKYAFENIRENNLLLYEYIRGSHAYGLNIETSDIDTSGIFCMTKEDSYGIDEYKVSQVADLKNDNVWYEIGKVIELLLNSNPTMLEALFIPEKYILYKHPAFDVLYKNRDIFITKKAVRSLVGYAKSQIHKARGLNKKIVNPVLEKKDVLDFCYTFKNQGTEPFKDFLNRTGLKPKYCGLVHLPNMEQMYGVYYDFGNHRLHEDAASTRTIMENFGFSHEKDDPIGYRGAVNEFNETTQLRLSSVAEKAFPICYISFNENGFRTHLRQYKEYQEWISKRNPQRFLENRDKEFDRKNMMHCARLLAMGVEMTKTGKVNIDRSNIDRDFLLKIRFGDTSYDELMLYLDNKLKDLQFFLDNSTLPEEVDKNIVNNILISIRNKINN